ncbi:flagellar filament capping protein FliD [Chitinibacter sp. S2-10]|uniref:flagellar filament capping protein FliD n=1 Tax=Chitinibacter sp. S2-10 TaxID=3373597 RepID=UPI003977D6C1
MSINTDYLKLLAQQMSDFKSNTLGQLGSSKNTFDINSLASGYIASQQVNQVLQGNTVEGIQGLSPLGRNLALPDPESAYKMMSHINELGMQYPAQASRLSDMQSGVNMLLDAAKPLAQIDATADFASVKQQLQRFADQYNSWRMSFDTDVQDPDLLADTQAAHVSRYELEQSIVSPFHGATEGFRGVESLGLSVNPATGIARLDTAKLGEVWAQNPDGVAKTINEMGQHFSRSAELLVEKNNFFAKQQDNLARVIAYMDENKTKLQAEFGLGDPPQPSEQVARAYAEYQRTHGLP